MATGICGGANSQSAALKKIDDGAERRRSLAQEKSPAFQFYPKDFLSDENQSAMTLPEVGAYARLMSRCWLEGSLPNDMDKLSRLCGATKFQMRQMWPAIQPCFREREDGRLVHPRLEKERKKQSDFKRRQADAAAARWNKDGISQTDATALPTREGVPDACSSVSDLRSPSASPKKIAPTVPGNLSVSPEIEQKAGRFLEKYPVIYAEERRGAHFQLKPVLHFMTACAIVQGWPDEVRLEVMFRTFCRLPSSEKMAWPGTPAQFLHLAPEIDAKLRAAGV